MSMIKSLELYNLLSRRRIYEIGCLGKIEQCQQLPNENYLIRLNGVIRFQIEKELDVTTEYRQVISNYSNFKMIWRKVTKI